ncbi:hypothetical protein MKX01_029763, partial [Papaver californicum]
MKLNRTHLILMLLLSLTYASLARPTDLPPSALAPSAKIATGGVVVGTGRSGSGHDRNWNYNWGWGSTPAGGWGSGSGTSRNGPAGG